MSIFKQIPILIGCFTLCCFASISTDQLSIGGAYLGVFNDFNKKQAQFDYATNINIEFDIAENLSGLVEFQSSPGNGSLGFEGPSAVVTDISLFYNLYLNNHLTKITFGSFDAAFGYETQFLSNNADTFNNLYIINSLTYAALAGQVGTLNTLGIQAENKYKYVDLTTSISNGTSETAYNENKTFEHLVQFSTHSLIDGLRITGTYFKSDDSHDARDSFQTNLTAILYEVNYLMLNTFNLKLKKADFIFDDQNSLTSDRVFSYEIELSYDKDPFFIGCRASLWRPQGSVSSSDIPNPGLLNTISGRIDRIQLTGGIYLKENIVYKSEVIHEVYDTIAGVNITKNTGVITGFNIQF
tara:strand:+ start:2161 stop:3225 length:1065 start_codon:yes stop_codon:yes gene_type:complete